MLREFLRARSPSPQRRGLAAARTSARTTAMGSPPSRPPPPTAATRSGGTAATKRTRRYVRSAPLRARPRSPGRAGATGPAATAAASARPRPRRLGRPRAALCERGGGGGGRGRRGAGGGGCLRTAGRGGAGPGRRALFRPGAAAAAAKVCLARGGQRRRVLPAGRAAAGAAHLREGGSPAPALRPCCVIASLGWRSSAGNGSARSARREDVSWRRKSREGGTGGRLPLRSRRRCALLSAGTGFISASCPRRAGLSPGLSERGAGAAARSGGCVPRWERRCVSGSRAVR